MIFLGRDNFILKSDCKKLIKFFNKRKKEKLIKHETENKVFNVVLNLNTENYFLNNFKKLIKDLNYISKLLNNSTAEYTHLYLNDNYDGGETYFEDGTVFKPKQGRIIFFDGQYYTHGVKPVLKNERYTIATWYK